ncbi:hypothetical protein ABEB36_014096 [Hypothenemus hampei]|uniref:STAS domain-containing protein n=1 Tax=Hypothenemus hampei TaxID=57062 RepID=A0ABD1E3K6_HYPHA
MPLKTKKFLEKKLPITQWLPRYSKEDVVADFIAGLTVGMTMIPQSVAYAALAGLKPQYGLYTAFIGSFTYVFVGTIKEVSIGPTSLMSLLTFSYVVGKPVEYAILLTFLAGCFELAMGFFQLGFLVDFISPCLTSGFTSATSIIIIIAQLKNLFGIRVKCHSTFPALKETIYELKNTQLGDALLSVFCIVFLLVFKQLTKIKTTSPRSKKTLWFLSISKNALVVFLSALISYIWYSNLGTTPFRLTGPVPRGLPSIGPPPFHVETNNSTVNFVDMVVSLGSGIMVVPIVAVLANVAIAKAYSQDAIVDASQEMMSLGLCNIFGSFVKAMPSCGAFTRSSVASSSGVRTPLQGIYSGLVIIFALSFLAPFFFYIPRASLASVLIVAASSLIDYEIFLILWKSSKPDFFVATITFSLGILVSVEVSIVIGAVLNGLILLKSWARPNILIETRAVGENGLKYLYIKPELGLFYPAADYLSERLKKAHKEYPSIPIAVDCSGFLQIDYSGAKSVEALLKAFKMEIIFINVHERVMKVLQSLLGEELSTLCRTSNEVTFPIKTQEETPLINGQEDRRYSLERIDIRKGSLCDLE